MTGGFDNQQINISGTDFDAQVYITQRHNKWLDRYIVVDFSFYVKLTHTKLQRLSIFFHV